jgi:competence protein ComEA
LIFCFLVGVLLQSIAISRAESPDAATAKVDLNNATLKQLEDLPGVGEATAQKIIDNRPYTSLDDLSKAGLSKSRIEKLDGLVIFGKAPKQGKSGLDTSKDSAAKIDVNTATAEELESLDGVGAATAKKIIDNRPYAEVSDLSKAGLSQSRIDKLEPLVTVGGTAVSAGKNKARSNETESAGKVDLNSATAEELDALPGVGKATAEKIISGRPYKSIDDFASRSGLRASEVEKLTPLVTVGAVAATPAANKSGRAAPSETPRSGGADSTTAKVDLNTATDKELEELPGVGPATAKKIVDGRPYHAIEDLTAAGLSEKEVEKLEPLVTLSPAAMAAGAKEAPAPPAKGMVWVNINTGVYHFEGSRWYGKTKEGKYMTEADAKKAGYHAAIEKISNSEDKSK